MSGAERGACHCGWGVQLMRGAEDVARTGGQQASPPRTRTAASRVGRCRWPVRPRWACGALVACNCCMLLQSSANSICAAPICLQSTFAMMTSELYSFSAVAALAYSGLSACTWPGLARARFYLRTMCMFAACAAITVPGARSRASGHKRRGRGLPARRARKPISNKLCERLTLQWPHQGA